MGGTFDPIHYGHLVTAEEALVQFALDRVLFMPAGESASKRHLRVSAPEHRYLMTVIATADNMQFEVSRREIDRPGVTYTVDTMVALRELHGPEASLYFITGADAVLEILTWKDSARLADVCTFIAATRPGYDLTPLKAQVGSLPIQVEFMTIPALAISSTDIRERMAAHRPVKYLLPQDVAAYAVKHRLYEEPGQ